MKSLARRLNDNAQVFIGIDQTGAVAPNGRPRGLPTAILIESNSTPELRTHDETGKALTLPALSPQHLPKEFAHKSSTALLVDCVFGLPQPTWPHEAEAGAKALWRLFHRAAQDESGRAGYGLKPAAEYFARILSESNAIEKPYPVRECELRANANSVFRTHPFQKNIQCGTYRIWRDLGQVSEPWAQIRHFERVVDLRDDQPWMFEAYPSLIWRKFLGVKTRDLTQLLKAIERTLPELKLTEESKALITSNPDHADAAVLAVGGLLLKRQQALFAESHPITNRALAKEGWIVGL